MYVLDKLDLVPFGSLVMPSSWSLGFCCPLIDQETCEVVSLLSIVFTWLFAMEERILAFDAL